MSRVPACVFVLAAAFALAGCGNDDDDASGGRYGGGPLHAVNDVAKEHSDWSPAEQAGVEIDADAEEASRACVAG